MAFTLLVFWYVFRDVDFLGLQVVLRKQDHSILLVAAALLFAQMVIGALRWQLIANALVEAREHRIATLAAMKIYYISMFFTCCLPGAVGGDVVRVWLAKSEHMPMPVSINSVIIDRMMALLALVLMVVFTMPVLGKALGFDVALVLPVVAVLAVIGLWLLFNAEKLLAPFKRFRLIHWVLYLINSIHMIIRTPRACAGALVLALVGQVIYAVSAWVLARSLGVDMTLLQSITLMPPVMLATTLPISIGGWGVREMGIVGMLGLIGIPQSAALVLSIQLGLLSVILSLPGSLLWLGSRKRIDSEK